MRVLVKKTILWCCEKYPMAKNPLLIWYAEFTAHRFDNMQALKAVYRNASVINGNRVVFNIKGNDYRLVVSVNYPQQACYVVWFGPHSAYDKIDVEQITYDPKIFTK